MFLTWSAGTLSRQIDFVVRVAGATTQVKNSKHGLPQFNKIEFFRIILLKKKDQINFFIRNLKYGFICCFSISKS
jgi:hypothetical protein